LIINLKTAKALGLTVPLTLQPAPTKSSNEEACFAAVQESACVLCAGFRTPVTTSYPGAPEAGVRKAPRHEIAGGTLGRPCRVLSYGDLSGEHAACVPAGGER
jgi:hypothetical protein